MVSVVQLNKVTEVVRYLKYILNVDYTSDSELVKTKRKYCSVFKEYIRDRYIADIAYVEHNEKLDNLYENIVEYTNILHNRFNEKSKEYHKLINKLDKQLDNLRDAIYSQDVSAETYLLNLDIMLINMLGVDNYNELKAAC